ncbi:hypothetical protein MHLNE_08940 [Moorella humiferrea]|uniref:helix-turn-helix domain-containing protein n=1 Tax=Neomoorella humiferrea TaxID=676965 RepID=UPI0030D480E6
MENLPLEKDVLRVHEIAKFLRVGKSMAYELTKRKDFPALRIGRTIRIPRDAFLQWVAQNLQR